VPFGADNWFVHSDISRQRWQEDATWTETVTASTTCLVCIAQRNANVASVRWTSLPWALLEIVCQCMTTVSCLLFAKLVGPPFAEFVPLSCMKSGWLKDAIQLMTLTVWRVLQPNIMTAYAAAPVWDVLWLDFQPYPRMSMFLSKLIYIAQFHAKHLNCARCTSN